MFTPLESAVGAILIHIGTSSFLAEAGRTIGFSSTITNAIFRASESVYPVAIVAGLLIATIFTDSYLPKFVPQYGHPSVLLYAIAGLLTGIGTQVGSGCTSGHMLSGLSLLRPRSLAATVVFSGVGMAIVNLLDLAPQCDGPCYAFDPTFSLFHEYKAILLGLLAFGYATSFAFLPSLGSEPFVKVVAGLNAGFLFGMGLFISGMANPAKPLGFLSIFRLDKFDPSLGMIILFAIVPNIIRWRSFIQKHPRPVLEPAYKLPTATNIPLRMLFGNSLFGLGWGLVGICPGPGFLGGLLHLPGAVWLGSFLLGYELTLSPINFSLSRAGKDFQISIYTPPSAANDSD